MIIPFPRQPRQRRPSRPISLTRRVAEAIAAATVALSDWSDRGIAKLIRTSAAGVRYVRGLVERGTIVTV